MAWFRNHFECARCGHIWEDEWSCGCDDSCPNCGANNMQVQESDDLSVLIEGSAESSFTIRWSPGSAGHDPDYIVSRSFVDRKEAEQFAQKASELVFPISSDRRNGWTADVFCRVQKIGKTQFELADVYAFSGELSALYPDNHHVREKIRQQLQVLRDLGAIEFHGAGYYELIV